MTSRSVRRSWWKSAQTTARRPRLQLQLESLEDRLAPAATRLQFANPNIGVQNVNRPLQDITVRVVDDNNVVQTNGTFNVTLAFGRNIGGSVLRGTVTLPTVRGVATFTGIVFSGGEAVKSANPDLMDTLLVSTPGLLSAESSAFAVKSGPTHVDFSTQPPASVQAGASLGNLKVSVYEGIGNSNVFDSDTSTVVALILENNSAGAKFINATTGADMTPTAKVISGVATFSNIALNKAGFGYTIRAIATNNPDLVSNASTSFTVTPAAAAKLAFLQQPTETVTGTAVNANLNPQGVLVQIQDRFDNLVTTATNTVTLALNGGQLASPQSVAAVAGVARFNDVRINSGSTGLTLTASSPNLTSTPVSNAFNIVQQATATQLNFTMQPTERAPSGALLGTVQVAVQNTAGATVTTDNSTVIRLASNYLPSLGGATAASAGYLAGNLTAKVVNGVATFNNVVLNGNLLPRFQIQGATNSNPIIINSPQHGLTNGAWVVIEGVTGNTNANGTYQISLQDGDNFILQGRAGNGNYTGGGTWSLAVRGASAASPIVITSENHGLRNGARVQIDGVQGLNGANGVYTVRNVTANTFQLEGSTGTGTWTMGTGKIQVIGNQFELLASSTNQPQLQVGRSQPFAVEAGAPFILTFLSGGNQLGPTAGATTFTAGDTLQDIVVAIKDVNNNTITTVNGIRISLSLAQTGLHPVATPLLDNGVITAYAVREMKNGVAIFSGVKVIQAGSGFQLEMSTDEFVTLPATQTPPGFNVQPGPFKSIAFTSQPQPTGSGNLINAKSNAAVQVRFLDQYGNPVSTGDGQQVSLSLDSVTPTNGATLFGMQSTGSLFGVAIFNDLGIQLTNPAVTATARLKATTTISGAEQTAFSNVFAVNLAPTGQVTPTSIAVTLTVDGVPVTKVKANQKFTATVQLLANGTPVTNSNVRLSLDKNPNNAINNGLAPILGGSIGRVTDATGKAVFTDLTINRGGMFQLQAISEVGGLLMAAPIEVEQSSTTVNFTTGTNPAPFGTPIVLNVQVTSPAGGTPTGTVRFFDGADKQRELGSVTLNNVGFASFTVPLSMILEAGNHTLVAVYGGDGGFNGSEQQLALTINPANVSIVATASASKITFGTAVTFTAFVNVQQPSVVPVSRGEVIFLLGVDVLATVPISENGTATYTTRNLQGTGAGSSQITVTYKDKFTSPEVRRFNDFPGQAAAGGPIQVMSFTPIVEEFTVLPNPATKEDTITLHAKIKSAGPFPEVDQPAQVTYEILSPGNVWKGLVGVPIDPNTGIANQTFPVQGILNASGNFGNPPYQIRAHVNNTRNYVDAFSATTITLQVSGTGVTSIEGGDSGNQGGNPPPQSQPLETDAPRQVLPNGASVNDVTQVGLGSYTNNFDTINNFPVYNTDASGQPLIPIFFPPSYTPPPGPRSIPNLSHPNEGTGFTQVPQTSDWWSSLIFRRTVAGEGATADPQGNLLSPLHAHPFSALPNQKGLGFSHLDYFETAYSAAYRDSAKTEPDPRFPSTFKYSTPYGGGTADNLASDRLYEDLAVELVGLGGANPLPIRYSDWTVTIDWSGKLQATIGQGLPYIFFDVPQGGQVQFTTGAGNRKITMTAFQFDSNGQRQNLTSGTGPVEVTISYTLLLAAPNPLQLAPGPLPFEETFTRTYAIFFPKDVAWNILPGDRPTLQTTGNLPANGYFSVASMTDDTFATFEIFRKHAYNFVTGGYGSFTFNENNSSLATTYFVSTVQKTGSGYTDLSSTALLALYPHQYTQLAPGTPVDPTRTWISPRGTMELLEASSFVTQLQYHGMLPFLPDISGGDPGSETYHRDLWRTYLLPYLISVSSTATSDGSLSLDRLMPGLNVYNNGQSLLGAMQLVPLLQEVSQSKSTLLGADEKELAGKLMRQVFEKVKERLGAWLSAQDDQALQLLYFEPDKLKSVKGKGAIGWNALLAQQAGFLSSESINDQHLGYGYYVKTAALIALYDPSWGDMQKFGRLMQLIMDEVANYRRDPANEPDLPVRFPFLRNFDVYAGQSWADGAGNGEDGTNQESTSEALNFASGLALWGQIIGDKQARDLGAYLYTTESNTFFHYYFDGYPSTNAMPDALIRGLRSVVDPGTAAQITYDLRWPNIPKPTTGTNAGNGYIFLGTVPIQSFTVGLNGVLTLTTINTENHDSSVLAQSGTLDFATGKITLVWNKAPGSNYVALAPTALKLTNLSIITNNGALFQTFFGLETSKLLGIQVLPLSGTSWYLSGLSTDPAFNANALIAENLQGALYEPRQVGGSPIFPDVYLTTTYAYQALLSPNGAADALVAYKARFANNTLALYNTDGSDNHAYNIHFMSVLNEYGTVDNSVTANTTLYTVFKKGNTRTYVVFNSDFVPRQFTFSDGFKTPMIAPRTMWTSSANTNQTTPANLSAIVTANRFFLQSGTPASPTQLPQNGTLVRGKTGSGEYAVSVPTPNTATNSPVPPSDPNKVSSFTLTGINGFLTNPGALPKFEFWVDPGWVTAIDGASSIGLQIQYDPTGQGDKSQIVTHIYNTIGLNVATPGYALYSSANQQVLINNGADVPLPMLFQNGKITVTFWAGQGRKPVNVRTDAAGEQGRVSWIEFPYQFSSVGTSGAAQQITSNVASSYVSGADDPVRHTPGTGHTYTATLTGTTATFQGNASDDTIVFDQVDGFLRHNRFTAGDPGFASDLDFDSVEPGVQSLLADSISAVIINTGTGNDTVRLGTPSIPVSALLATFTVNNEDGGNDFLFVDDGARDTALRYEITGTSIQAIPLGSTETIPLIHVIRQGSPFAGGVRIITGTGADESEVQATRAGEPLTMDTTDGNDLVVLTNEGDAQQILASVTIVNTENFTRLAVVNRDGVNASNTITVAAGSITGLTPAPVLFDPEDIDEYVLLGGTNDTTWNITATIAGGENVFWAGTGRNTFILGKDGVISSDLFPGMIAFVGGDGEETLLLDNRQGAGAQITIDDTTVGGLAREPINVVNMFDKVALLLADGGNNILVQPNSQVGMFTLDIGDGTNDVRIEKNTQPILVEGGAGEDRVTVVYDSSADQDIVIFHAGGGTDRLALEGGTFNRLTWTLQTGGSGSVVGDAAGVITFTGLDQALALVDDLTVTERVFNLTDEPDFALLQAGSAGRTLLSTQDTALPIDFLNPTGRLEVHGQGGDDVLRLQALDTLFSAAVELHGDAGADELRVLATGPKVSLLGGADDDLLLLGNGVDLKSGTVDGGSGIDTLDYSQFTTAVAVNLGAGTATNTGGIVETSIENARGGSAGDTLIGSDAANRLEGAGGNDSLTGGKGADTLFGESDDDLMIWNNGDGSDVMNGGTGTDTVQVNGAATGNDAFTVVPNGDRVKFDRTNLGLFSLDIGTTEVLEVNGLGGSDSLDATPLADTRIKFNGADQEGTAGDALNVQLGGQTGFNLTRGEVGSGEWTFNGRQPISFTGVEQVTPTQIISGQKFNDLDGDGKQGAGEPGLVGWTIQLDTNLDDKADTTVVTDEKGNYAFTFLAPGTYRVREVGQAGWTQSSTNPADITLSAGGGDATGIGFGNFQQISLNGQVFDDRNGNGIKDPGEPGLAGVQIQLDRNADGSIDAATTTDSQGNYSFANVGPGPHRLIEVAQAQRAITSPNNGVFTVQPRSGQNQTGLDFGTIADANRTYIYHVYLDLLGRRVDTVGIAYWSDQLAQGVSRAGVVRGIEASEEYRARIVEDTYLKYLRRPSDPAGRANWILYLGTGGNQVLMEAFFLASDEYFAVRSGGTNDGFLTALYGDVLGRPVDSQGAAAFGNALRQGVSRITVALAVLRSEEAGNRIIPDYYQRFLGRPADPAGQRYWVASFVGGATIEELIQGFVGSDEYFARF